MDEMQVCQILCESSSFVVLINALTMYIVYSTLLPVLVYNWRTVKCVYSIEILLGL